MATNSKWLIPKRVFYIHFSGKVEIDEVHQGNELIKQALAEGESPIHTIVDVSGLTGYPIDMRLIRQSYPFNDKSGWVVLAGASGVIKYVGNFLTSVAKTKIQNVASQEAALSFLREKDETLKEESA